MNFFLKKFNHIGLIFKSFENIRYFLLIGMTDSQQMIESIQILQKKKTFFNEMKTIKHALKILGHHQLNFMTETL